MEISKLSLRKAAAIRSTTNNEGNEGPLWPKRFHRLSGSFLSGGAHGASATVKV